MFSSVGFLKISALLNASFRSFSEGVADADLVLLVTTRPTTGNTLAWAVACERDQWGRAIAGMVLLFDLANSHYIISYY